MSSDRPWSLPFLIGGRRAVLARCGGARRTTWGDADPDAAPAVAAVAGTDRCTPRAVVELDLALDADVTLDAASAVVSDPADRASGPGSQRWYTEAPEPRAAATPSAGH